MWFVMFLASPLSYPISKLLDCFFGSHSESPRYKIEDLKGLILIHRKSKFSDCTTRGLMPDQVKIILGAIEMMDYTVGDRRIPIERVWSLSSDTVITQSVK